MLIIGCDYHPGMQQIAWFDNESGEYGEQRLEHATGEAEKFYRELKRRGVQVRVGIEASGHTRWFERLLAELEMELWIGNPAKIAAQRVRKQKNDRGDAQLCCSCCGKIVSPAVGAQPGESRPAATAVASASSGADANAGQESVARHRASTKAYSESRGCSAKQDERNWNRLRWLRGRRADGTICCALLDQLTPQIAELSQAIEQEAQQRPEVQRLMTHPGVGPITALAFVLVLGTPIVSAAANRWAVIWD